MLIVLYIFASFLKTSKEREQFQRVLKDLEALYMGLLLKYNLKMKLLPLCCRQNSLPRTTTCRLHVSLLNLT